MKKKSGFDCSDPGLPFCWQDRSIRLFDEMTDLRLKPERYVVRDRLNAVGVSADFYEKHRDEKPVLINCETGASIRVVLQKAAVEPGSFVASLSVKEALSGKEDGKFRLGFYRRVAFQKIMTQKIAHIRENNIAVSRADYDRIRALADGIPFCYFEVYNSRTKESMIVQRTHICPDDTMEPGSIRLSRKQRICLGMELPLFLPEEQWQELTDLLSGHPDQRETIFSLYGATEDRALDRDAPYDIKMKAKQIIREYCPAEICIVPVLSTLKKPRRGIGRRLSDFYVGRSTIALTARRPYDIDEGLDIVRMSESNMKLLGIDEMDKVTLQYENQTVSCRVLELDNSEAFFETNRPISPDLAVGIPAHIRKKLGVMDQTTLVKIDRDTAFIFRKSLNEQVVPILLTLFSTNLFAEFSVWVTVILSLVAVPVVLYLNLSSKRNMRT